jgi:hypothetical protein
MELNSKRREVLDLRFEGEVVQRSESREERTKMLCPKCQKSVDKLPWLSKESTHVESMRAHPTSRPHRPG